MADTVTILENIIVMVCDPEGPKIKSESDAADLMGEMLGSGAEWIVIPVVRLTEDFFELKTGVAGHLVQKFVTYKRKLAVLGDVSQFTSTSRSFRDFVYETNKGQQIWFLPDMEEFARRLK
ncbi:MAG: DUF4180 domain-containing protein [Chloroflexi bacterium]|nr:DUF4180 domain-containing protein [Chloroflexota bacterium]OJV97205.1 MAG: alpha/beta hydrolase [Chloroflexi bacterium 54-19]